MRRRPCNAVASSPCARGFNRRVPVLFRRGAPRGGGSFGIADPKLYGLANFSSTNYMAAAAGGELGSASGFGSAVAVVLTSLPSGNQMIVSRSNSGGNQGWYLQCQSGVIKWVCGGNGSTAVASATYAPVASDLGKVLLFTGVHTGTGVRLIVNRAQLGADVAITGYTPPTGLASELGNYTSQGQPFTAGVVLSHLTFTGVPSVSQVAALADATRFLGDLPPVIDGATVTHRWSVKDELRGVSNPAGRKSYGLRGFTAVNRLRTSAVRTWGSASGFFVACRFRVDTQGVSSAFRALMDAFQASPNRGLQLLTTTTNAGLILRGFDATNAIVDSPAYTIPSNAIGLVITCLAFYDPGTSKAELYVDRVRQGTGTAQASVATSSTDLWVGAQSNGTTPADGVTIFGTQYGAGVPTAGEIAAFFDACEQTGTMQPITRIAQHLQDFTAAAAAPYTAPPATVSDSIGADALSVVGTLELGVQVATSPPCPAQLTDSATRAVADALARQGSPSVITIDPAIDGRRTLGAQGFSAANYFIATSTGIRLSAAGGSVSVIVRPDVTPTTGHHVISSYNATATAGWSLSETPGSYRLDTFNAGGGYTPGCGTWSPAAGDLGKLALITIVYTGSAWRLFVNGLQQGADVASSFLPNTTLPLQVGAVVAQNVGYDSSIFGVCGGTGAAKVPTYAEVQQQYADFLATGRIVGIPGKVDGLWDFTADIIASGIDAVPATILDRVGTDHLLRQGPDYAIAGKQGLRLQGTGTTLINGLQTAPGGGIIGGSTALTVSLLASPIAVITNATEIIASRLVGTLGWDFRRGTGGTIGTIQAALATSATGVATASYTFLPGDFGTLMHFAMTWDGVSVRFYVNGTLMGTPTALGGTFTAPNTPMIIGMRSDGFTMNNNTAFFAVGGGAYVATQAELAAQAAASLSTGQLPAIPGRTDDRRYNYVQDAIDQATPLPARCIDRMGTADALVRAGSGLTVAQRKERVWSYETTSIMQSVSTPTPTTARYESAAGVQNAGDAAGYFVAPLVRCVSATNGRFLANSQGGVGWYFNYNSGLITFAFADSVSLKTSGNITAAADGKVRPILGVFDAPTSLLRAYAARAQIGTGVAASGYTTTNLASIGVAMGAFWGGSSGSAGVEILGFVMGYGVPTLAEFREWEEACCASEDIVALGGKKSAHMYSVKRGRTATQLTDLIGSVHLPIAGGSAPTLVDIYGRAFAV